MSGALLKMRDSNPSAFSAALGALLPAPYNEQLHHTLTAYKGKELDNHLIQVRARSYLVAMQLAICNSLEIAWKMKRARLHHSFAFLISHAISSELHCN